jgi:crotonyl-CoA carboxylase/reductase
MSISVVERANDTGPRLDVYDVGVMPPLGHVPAYMHAWTVRRERHGEPEVAMQLETLPIPSIAPNEVLVFVMAAGINYNGVWAALGQPISVLDVHGRDFHVPGSDASGIVWAVGSSVRRWKVGDEVVVHCNQDDGDDEECNGGDPMLSTTQRIWGYETPYGSFAQFTVVQDRQLVPRPHHLSWQESACYMLTLATAYRMLFGHPPHTLRPGSNVLVWGGAGGLGTMAIQLVKATGANAIAVISSESKREYVMSLGAKGAINRTEFDCWRPIQSPLDTVEYKLFLKEARRFGNAVRAIAGDDPDIVVEHPGEQTFATSCYVVKRGGMVVICAGTTGYTLTMDARILWIRQKRVQGSHFATLRQASNANDLVRSGLVKPSLSETFRWDEIPLAHAKMRANQHPAGNMAALIGAS